MTQAEQVQWSRGLAASNLLANEDFIGLLRDLTVEGFARFTESRPEDQQGRETIYNLCLGLRAIEDELRARVQAKDTIERDQQIIADDNQDDQQ